LTLLSGSGNLLGACPGLVWLFRALVKKDLPVMFQRVLSLSVWVSLVAILAGSGCFFGGPSRVHPPDISASAAGSGSMERYDTNKDGVVKGDELEKAPSLKAAIKQLDADGDGGVSADEVADRVRAWQDSKVGKMSVSCMVTVNGKGLAGANVTFEPEEFLGTEIKPCTGTTDEKGIANLTMEVQGDDPPGVACGLYLVRISKQEGGRELLPARYNTGTTLGKEAALDAEEMQEGMVRFELTVP